MGEALSSSGMLGRQGTDRVGVQRLLSAERTQLRFQTLTDGALGDSPDEDLLGGGVQPTSAAGRR
jgi:hypothetical protein